ncbi:MAG: hypothetical protein ACREIT_07885, partial [Tepidisphaeraceae bacterium]
MPPDLSIPERPFSPLVLTALVSVLLGSVAMFYLIIRRWTMDRQWVMLREWASSNGMKLWRPVEQGGAPRAGAA